MTIGLRIKAVRASLNLTQEAFGEKIAVSRTAVTHYEKETKTPSLPIIKNICREFYISEEWLLHGTGERIDKERMEEEEASRGELLWMADTLEKSFHDLSVYMKEFENDHHTVILETFDALVPVLMKSMDDEDLLFEYHDELFAVIGELERFIKAMDDIITGTEYSSSLDKFKAYSKRLSAFQSSIGNSSDKIFELLNADFESSKKSSIIEETQKAKQPLEFPKVSREDSPYSVYQSNDILQVAEQPEAEYNVVKRVPVVGNVAAGKAIEVYNHVDDLIDVPGSMTVDYALNVKGNSMEPLIADGSLIFVKQQEDINQGEIGIFLIDDNVTCKRYHRTDDSVILRSENKEYPDMVFGPESNIRIIGKVLLTKNV